MLIRAFGRQASPSALRPLLTGATACLFCTAVVLNFQNGRERRELSAPPTDGASRRQVALVAVPGEADILVFHESDCLTCKAAAPLIQNELAAYPGIQSAWVEMTDPEGKALEQRYERAYGIPPGTSRPLPFIYVGSETLAGLPAVKLRLPTALAQYVSGSSPPPSLNGHSQSWYTSGTALESGIGAARSASGLAGLLIFLAVLCLASAYGRQALLAGGSLFIGAAWVAYLLAEFGAFRSLYSHDQFLAAASLLYPLGALVGAWLTWISFRTFGNPESGRKPADGSANTLPQPRDDKAMLIQMAAGAGFLVALLGFTSMNGAGLPSLIYRMRTGPDRSPVLAALAVYNFALLSPHLAALVLAAWAPPSVRDRIRHGSLGWTAIAASTLATGYLLVVSLDLFGIA